MQPELNSAMQVPTMATPQPCLNALRTSSGDEVGLADLSTCMCFPYLTHTGAILLCCLPWDV